MISLIEVKCPHCGVMGQVMLPPMGSLIVGPCPQCAGMVALFCGKVLALDTEVFKDGSNDAKREHLREVLTKFVNDRVDRLFEEPIFDTEDEVMADDMFDGDDPETTAEGEPRIRFDGDRPKRPITPEEQRMFQSIELRLIDDPEYFRSVFG